MGAGIIIQARLTSKRFPNKMLCTLLGKPVLQWVIEAVEKTNIPFCVAIPDTLSDEGLHVWIGEWATKNNKKFSVLTGQRDDLILRFKEVNNELKYDPIIRICGDSPFFAPEDIKLALKIYNERGYYTMLNHVQVFSPEELEYQNKNDPFIESRQHAGTRGMAHTVDYPEDIKRYTKEWVEGSPTMNGRRRLWGIE